MYAFTLKAEGSALNPLHSISSKYLTGAPQLRDFISHFINMTYSTGKAQGDPQIE